LGAIVLWASYGFRYSATADGSVPMNNRLQAVLVTRARLMLAHPGHRPTAEELAATPPGRGVRLALFLDEHHLLPEACINGLLFAEHMSLIRPSYLLGEVRQTGWWYYFPLAVLFKTPLATLIALSLAAGIGVASLLRRRIDPETAWAMVCLLVPAAIYLAVAMSSHLNLGLRHVLPVYPPLFVAAGVALARVWRIRPAIAGAAAGALLCGLATATLLAWPDYIPFFNAAAGGTRGGLRLLGDSNLDWGQDLKALGGWQRRHPDVRLYLDYFGAVDPRLYVRAERFDPSALAWPGEPGVLAVSATNLQGIYLSPPARAFYAPLRRREPRAVIGGSIYLFDVPGGAAPAPAEPAATRPAGGGP
jgi:hypothetical protein